MRGKIGVCGHYAKQQTAYDGQTVKTRVFCHELEQIMGKENVLIVDTKGWRKHPVSLVVDVMKLFIHCENIVAMPADRGINIIIPMFCFLNFLFHKKTHYVVVGGWLPMYVKRKFILIKCLHSFHGIYVETMKMKKMMEKYGLKNVVVMPNFKHLQTIDLKEAYFEGKTKPYKLCTFSRVMKEKGIEDAILAVKKVNEKKENTFTLDIYGSIEPQYREEFTKLLSQCPPYIKYCGIVPYGASTSVLKRYFSLLFPTYYKGEGFPGTIIDAYAAGLPVIASDWHYNSEIVKHKNTGIVLKKEQKLFEILEEVSKNPDMLNSMRNNCLDEAKKYLPKVAIQNFIKNLEGK